jgi:heme-degrading monooxygenase HmoA
MISRIWHGRASRENADRYRSLLEADVLPGIGSVAGYRGVTLLRRDDGDSVEFVAITLWDSLDAIRAWAGEPVERAVIAPEPARLLSSFDEFAVHYETLLSA